MARVQSGLEVFLAERARQYRGQRIGLLANAASVDSSLRSAIGLIASAPGLELRALFGPEHGLLSGAQDMIPIEGEQEQGTGLKVHSLYGDSVESLSPQPKALQGLDLLVADLQDVGARYYTFATTIAFVLDAVAGMGGRLLLLDRPNPVGGLEVEGPGLSEGARSFVGHFEVPIRHGLTIGEILLHHARTTGHERHIDVVPMRGWTRSMDFDKTGLPWVPPSPNMPTVETAFVYPGSCLVEGTNLSEGRGTTKPFEWIGAPFLDPEKMARSLGRENLPGVVFRAVTFVPAFHKWAGRSCGGVALHVTDRESFLPVRTGLALLISAKRLAPSQFAWRRETYEFVSDRPAIDLLTGGSAVREAIDAGAGLAEIARSWQPTEGAWRAARQSSLLYT